MPIIRQTWLISPNGINTRIFQNGSGFLGWVLSLVRLSVGSSSTGIGVGPYSLSLRQ